MVSQKRKRESYATPTSNEAEDESETPQMQLETVPVTSSPFTVVYAKPGDVKPKKNRTGAKDKMDYNDHTAAKDEAGVTESDPAITYMVLPGSLWESMKKYKNFIVSEKQFGVNDFIYVNNGSSALFKEIEDDKQFWIARVLEVRASSPSAVYLRVYWMYWPTELPSGQEYYHGKSELVASNHMEIIDAMTVSGMAEVIHLVEQDDAPTATGLYWRQKFDFETRKLSLLKRDCVCKQYHNPDKLLVHCVNNSCGKWMHEDCLLRDATDKAWARLNGKQLESSNDTIEVTGSAQLEDTIQVNPKASGTASGAIATTSSDGVRKPSSMKGKSRRKSNGKKGETGEPEWRGQLEARLETKSLEADDEENTEITGNVIFEDKRSQAEPTTWNESLACFDDTSVAILEKHDSIKDCPSATLHFHEKITADNSQYGGIHPLTALDSHQSNLGTLVAKSLLSLPDGPHDASLYTPIIPVRCDPFRKRKPDFVSVTRGPGMRSSLSTGLDTAKGLAIAWQIPLLGINHMQAHALTPRLVSALSRSLRGTSYKPYPNFPFLSLMLSGGHTLLLHSKSLTQHPLLATTTDIALGDFIDKIARAVLPPAVIASNGSNTSYGRSLEIFSFPNGHSDYAYHAPLTRGESITRSPTPYSWSLGSPLAETRGGRGSTRMEYSFSGLDSAVRRIVGAHPEMGVEERKGLAREAMRVAFEHVAERVVMALQNLGTREKVNETAGEEGAERIPQTEVLVVSGGVAANGFLRAVLRAFLTARGFPHVQLVFPPPALCTDNAAMIAWAGMEMWEAGWESELSVRALRKWGLDEKGTDGGLLGIGGWKRRDGM
ncbi:hypothetical protein MMC17_003431 [Xylographa soralifera]|nr:hypothetical protein [Xylographa soralifera]